MRGLLAAILILGVLVGTGCASRSSDSNWDKDREVNLVLLGESGDHDSVATDSRAFKRVAKQVAGQLAQDGFNVYLEGDIGLSKSARIPLTAKIDKAQQHLRPPLDVAVVLNLRSRVTDKNHVRILKARVEGQVVNLSSGRAISEFGLSIPSTWRLRPSCLGSCLDQALADNSPVIANELGALLSLKLGWMLDDEEALPRFDRDLGGAFTIELDGFTPHEMFEIEDALTRLSGFSTHRVVYSGQRRAEYWYETTMASSRLHRNIRYILDTLEHRSAVRYSGNTFAIEKIARSRKPIRSEGW